MKKKLLSEAQIRRFMGLAGLNPINEMADYKKDDEEPMKEMMHNEGEEDELMDYPGKVEEEWIDVMEGLKSNNWTWQQHQRQQEESLQTVVSPRWERALDQWGKYNDKRRVKPFLRTLCRQEFQPMERLELRWNRYKIVPPATTSDENDVAGRWLPSTSKPTVISVTCDKQ